MRILHSGFMISREPGIAKQMTLEEKGAHAVGLNWRSILYVPGDSKCEGTSVVKSEIDSVGPSARIIETLAFWFAFRRAYYKWLMNESIKYDVVLLRYSVYDPFLVNFMRKCRRPVVTVHHTLEVPELLRANTKMGKLKGVVEYILGPRAIKRTAGIVAVTDEVVEYEKKRSRQKGKPCCVYPNGVLYNDNDVDALKDKRSLDFPELLFVAGHFTPPRGLDLLLESLRWNQEQFVLHLVGEVYNAEKVMAQRDNRVVLHGFCDQRELLSLSASAWVGLSSFALERKAMNKACTLKVRDYLSRGVPVYAGHFDVFPEGFFAYRKGPPDIEKIIEYARQMRFTKKADIAEEARPFISKEIFLKKLSIWADQVEKQTR